MKLCNHPGCKQLITNDLSRCDKHKIVRNEKKYLDHQFLIIDGRKQYLYTSSKWRKLAKKHKQQNPCCIMCELTGIIRPVEVSDHIIPVEVDPLKAFDVTNIQSLCLSCHNVKTQQDNRKYNLSPKKRFNSPFKKSRRCY